MTDSNGQRVPNGGGSSPIPGTEVTTTPGILPETFTVDTSDLNLDLNIEPPTFENDPLAYVPPVDTHAQTLDEIHTHLHELHKKIDHLLEHHHKQGLPTYEGTVNVTLYPHDTHVPNDDSSTPETTV